MHVHLYAYRCISRMQGYSRNCDNGCKEGHEVCGDFLPLYIFVLVLCFRTCGCAKFQNKTDKTDASKLS